MGRKPQKRSSKIGRFRNTHKTKEDAFAELADYGISESAARRIHKSGEINDEFQDRYWLEYTEAIYVRELIDFVFDFDQ